MLTDKAKEDFCKWAESHTYMVYHGCPESCQNALITEWLDSVEIYITLMGYDIAEPTFEYTIQEKETLNGMNGFTFKSRHEAIEKAIEKANEIYNQKIK